MRSSKLHSAFVRRRELEQMKIEKSVAVDKYFDKWGRITSTYEQWTTPEFYKQADENNRQRELDKIKNEALENRREKLRKLLDEENKSNELILNEINRPQSKRIPCAVLNDVYETIKRTEEEKRRLDMESKLYKKWRNGFSENSILLDSKSDHEALAKMNWLDKQVADQLERDREKRQNEERQLRLQEEARKHQEFLSKRRIQRDEEVNELKSFQTTHMNELKSRQCESDELRMREFKLIQRKEDISKELEILNLSVKQRKERILCPFNLRRIKMILRQRSETVRQDLKNDIDMLHRISLGYEDEQFNILNENFELQYDLEIQKQTQIEAMYESEAKHLLVQQEELWNEEAQRREKQLRKLITQQLENIDKEIDYNVKRQRELVEIKEQHLVAMESSSLRLKELLDDQSRDESRASSRLSVSTETRKDDLNDKMNELKISGGPRFGRKKIAWT